MSSAWMRLGRREPEELLRGGEGIGVGLVAAGRLVNGPVRAGADCKLKPALVRVTQATRLCRPATRRTERAGRFEPMRTAPVATRLAVVPVGGSPTGAGESPALPTARAGKIVAWRWGDWCRDSWRPEGW